MQGCAVGSEACLVSLNNISLTSNSMQFSWPIHFIGGNELLEIKPYATNYKQSFIFDLCLLYFNEKS